MSTETETTSNVTVTEAPKAVKAKKAPVKKAPAKAAKKSTKKAAPKAKKAPKSKGDKPAEYGVDKSHDVPWCEKKVAIIKALKTLKATSPTSAVATNVVAEKANVSSRDVRHYCYHAKVSGLTGVAETEELRGYGFYLTAKGQKCDPVAEFKTQSKKD